MPKTEGASFFRKRTDPIQMERQELVEELRSASMQLQRTYAHFDRTADPDLIDACVYEINALQARYSYLLRRVKEMGPES